MNRRQFLLTSGTALTGVLGASAAASAGPTEDGPDVRSYDVDVSYGTVDEPRHEVKRGGTSLFVSGRVQGSEGCSALAYAGFKEAARRWGTDRLRLARVRDGQVCTQAMTVVDYELELAFEDRARSDVDVSVVDDPGVDALVRQFETRRGSGRTDHDVEIDRQLDRAHISGTVSDRSSCDLQVAAVRNDGGRATVVLKPVSTDECSNRLSVDYDLVVEFPNGAPKHVDVEVADRKDPRRVVTT